MSNTFRERAKELVSKMTLGEKISQTLHSSPSIPRLGIPEYNWWNECLHGVGRSGVATVFPQAIGLASSFDTDLMYDVATAISDEARGKYHEYQKYNDGGIYKGLTFWSPNINIFRDPRWGRGHETYGEDPYLTGSMGTAFIKGLQGDDPNHRKVDATIKHYAVHSGPEGDRHHFDAVVSKKDLYETYLAAFKQCIDEAQPAAVMGAYNRVNGEACCASPTLLGQILRRDWGFEGYVVSDCGAICDINKNHKITENEAESAALAVNNGCELNCGHAYKHLMTAVERGLIMEQTITNAVELLYEARFRLGMFDDQSKVVYSSIPYDVVDCVKHKDLTRKVAAATTVLLKNDGILPLSKDVKNIAVIGPNANDRTVLLGNYEGTPSMDVTILEGIRNHISQETTLRYAVGCHLFKSEIHEWAEHPQTEAIIAADKADVVVFVGGLSPSLEGEESDDFNGTLSGDKLDIELPLPQRELFDVISKRGKPIIFINVSGSAVALNAQNERANAVIQSFYPGAQGGNAVADIIFGDVSPSAKLPVTFYKSTDDLPDFSDYSMANRTYRYFEHDALYPFGYGLSYTKFSYSNIRMADTIKTGDGIKISVEVTNCGDYDGKEIVQLYGKHLSSEFEVYNHRLLSYKAVSAVKGETITVEFDINPRRLAVINNYGQAVIESGDMVFYIGGSQPDAVSKNLMGAGVLEAVVTIEGDISILDF